MRTNRGGANLKRYCGEMQLRANRNGANLSRRSFKSHCDRTKFKCKCPQRRPLRMPVGGSCDFNLLGRVRKRALVEPFCFRGFDFCGDKFCAHLRFITLLRANFMSARSRADASEASRALNLKFSLGARIRCFKL